MTKPRFDIGDLVRFGDLTGVVLGHEDIPRMFEDDEANAFYWDVALGPRGPKTYIHTKPEWQRNLTPGIYTVFSEDLEAWDGEPL